jgi:hypothetical protein
MPKKKKGGKAKKGKAAAVVDPVADAAEAERLALAKEAKQLYQETKKEEEEYNMYQQQREKLNYFWIVEKKNLDDKKAELRNKERELQDLEEKHQVEIKVYKQRLKHLLYEHQDEVTTLKTDAEISLKLAQDEHRGAEAELKADRRGLKLASREMELAHEEYVKSLKRENDRSITTLREEFEMRTKELQLKYDRRRKAVRDTLERERKEETARIEERKNAHIRQLMKGHEKAFLEIKTYYTDITHNNLDLIKSLKEEVAEMKKKDAEAEREMTLISQENKRMSEPLKKALQDRSDLQQAKGRYGEELGALATTKANLLVVEQELAAGQWEHEVLSQRFEKVRAERDELYARFQATVYDVQQKSGFKNLLLERKLTALSEALEQKEAQLNEVVARANIDPAVLGGVQGSLDDIIEAKNQSVRQLQQELEGMIAAHQDLVQASEEKMAEYGVPMEELGFVPQSLGVTAAEG